MDKGNFARFELKMDFLGISHNAITSCIHSTLSQNWPEIDPMLLVSNEFRPSSGTLKNIKRRVFTLPYHQMRQFTRRSGLCAKFLFSVLRPRDKFIILFSIYSFLAISCYSHSSPLKRRKSHQKPATHMMTSSNGNIFRITGPLCVEFTGHRRIPHTKASDAELWCLLWSASE